METFSTEIYSILDKSRNVVISAHVNPDGDAVGAVMAFALVVEEIGGNPIVLLDKYSEKYNFINGRQFIFDGSYDDIEPDVFVSVDCGEKERLGAAAAVFDRANTTFNIDHHISNENFAQNNIVYPDASSSSEVVFEIIKNFSIISKDIAAAVYTGIVTDTFGFKHKSTSPKTLDIAARLVETGIPFSEIQQKVLYERSINEVKAFSKALDNFKVDGNIAYTFLTFEEMEKCGVGSGDLDGIVEYILNIDGIDVSAFLYEKDKNKFKISLRAKEANVNAVAKAFGGGGHILASGASFDGALDEALQAVLSEIKKELNSNG